MHTERPVIHGAVQVATVVSAVSMLLQHGADVNATYADKLSPLAVAFQWRWPELVRLLIGEFCEVCCWVQQGWLHCWAAGLQYITSLCCAERCRCFHVHVITTRHADSRAACMLACCIGTRLLMLGCVCCAVCVENAPTVHILSCPN
jgi:hypothetical protein